MARDKAYEEAEQRIEQARREELPGLDLANMSLTEVPDALGNLTQLRSPNLSSADREQKAQPARAALPGLQRVAKHRQPAAQRAGRAARARG